MKEWETNQNSKESGKSLEAEEFDEAWLEEFGEMFMSWFEAWLSAAQAGPLTDPEVRDHSESDNRSSSGLEE